MKSFQERNWALRGLWALLISLVLLALSPVTGAGRALKVLINAPVRQDRATRSWRNLAEESIRTYFLPLRFMLAETRVRLWTMGSACLYLVSRGKGSEL